jgi:L-aminopeptidase/D-esterase-like protein
VSVDFSPFGIVVGHATNAEGVTGCTVVRGDRDPFRAAASIVGRATGTRELDALSPNHLVDRVDAILLTGGSAYGLGAADGVMRWMEERRRGFSIGNGVVPIVPAAVIFDLGPLGAFGARPTPEMAYAACDTATSADVAEGSVGAGTGATVGKGLGIEHAMKGGLGCWVERADPIAVGAIAVVNALGDVRDGSGAIIAGARDAHGGFLDVERQLRTGAAKRAAADDARMRNTTLAVVMTNASLSRLALAQLASSSSSALARRITPVGTSYDGDIIFAICPVEGPIVAPVQVEALAAYALEQAIERAVRLARGTGGVPGLADETLT